MRGRIADVAEATLECTQAGHYAVHGPLVFATVPSVLATGRDAITTQPVLTFDLSGVSRADSAGLALLIEWLRMARRGGTRIEFLHVPDQLAEIATACHVDGLLKRAQNQVT